MLFYREMALGWEGGVRFLLSNERWSEMFAPLQILLLVFGVLGLLLYLVREIHLDSPVRGNVWSVQAPV